MAPRPRISSSRIPLITLLTDFGTVDYFVGAMKGMILSINPNARIIDITHEIPPQDIEAAAFTLLAAYSSFPLGTIHIAVVDPEVGSARKAILVEAGDQFFVGPDNGVFSYVFQREPGFKAYELTNQTYFHSPVSATFQGRDIFAPVAAALAGGVTSKKLGREIVTLVRLEPLLPEKLKDGRLKGRIIHIDRYGNCITNIRPEDLTKRSIENGAYLSVNGTEIASFQRFFSEKSGSGGKPFCVWGSAGFLELAVMNRSAADILKVERGQPVTVIGKPAQF